MFVFPAAGSLGSAGQLCACTSLEGAAGAGGALEERRTAARAAERK